MKTPAAAAPAPASPAAAVAATARPSPPRRRAQAGAGLRVARVAVVALLMTTLLAAVAGGLWRAGATWALPQAGAWAQAVAAALARAVAGHAALMLPAFFGAVISVERAAAVKLRWAWAAPLAAAASALCLLAGRTAAADACGIFAAAVAVAVHLVVLRRQRAAHTALLVVAALAWLVGSVLHAAGAGVAAALGWWFALPVLTIAAERLEMTRLTRRHAAAVPALMVVTATLLAGAALAAWPAPGPDFAAALLYGGALAALAAWLGWFDIARRTLFATGLPRYMAVCLLSGYAWLALAGCAWVATALGAPWRDVALHALGLGFIVGMVFGHAPVILPAVAGVKLLFGPWFYAPLLLLHATLALRLGGGLLDPHWRSLGSALNAAALAVFAATVVGSALAWRWRKNPRRR